MQRISLHDAQPGMVLAADVVNAQQMLLLKKGAQLSDANIKILKSWGVTNLAVAQPQGAAQTSASPGAESCLENIVAAAAIKFADVDDDPVTAEIRRVAIGIIAARQTNPL